MTGDTDSARVGFGETLWSVVLRAGDRSAEGHPLALETLCQKYWRSVYAYLRRKGHSVEDAKDATQAFFVHLLEQDLLERADPDRGRFRSWLIAVLEHFLANRARIAKAARRGSGRPALSFDFQRAESDVSIEPVDPAEGPIVTFQRLWARSVLAEAFEAVRRDFEARGLPGWFDAVRDHLAASRPRATYAELAGRLGITVTDVTNLLHRTRKLLRLEIRNVLAQTTASEADLEQEIRDFRAWL